MAYGNFMGSADREFQEVALLNDTVRKRVDDLNIGIIN